MPTSLFAPDFQSVLDRAKQTAGTSAGPVPSPEDWRDPFIYFLMLDRFNNATSAPNHAPFDDPNFFEFQGGKFSGSRSSCRTLSVWGLGRSG